jgi:hypothetical protein
MCPDWGHIAEMTDATIKNPLVQSAKAAPHGSRLHLASVRSSVNGLAILDGKSLVVRC